MASISWPDDLPDKQFEPVREEANPGKIRTEMDEGPAKVRPTVTAVRKVVTIQFLMNGQEKSDFKDFYENDLDNGTNKFDWESPVDDSTVEYRFVQRPDWDLINPHSDWKKRIWKGPAKMEVLPS